MILSSFIWSRGACRVRHCCTFRSHLCTRSFRPLDMSHTTFLNYSAIQFLWLARVSPTGSITSIIYLYFILSPLFFCTLLCGPPHVCHFCNFRTAKIALHARAFAKFCFLEIDSDGHFFFLSCGCMRYLHILWYVYSFLMHYVALSKREIAIYCTSL